MKEDLFLLDEKFTERLLAVRLRGVDSESRLCDDGDDVDSNAFLVLFLVFLILWRLLLFASCLKRYNSAYRVFSVLVPLAFKLATISSAGVPCHSTTKFCKIESSMVALVWLFTSASGYKYVFSRGRFLILCESLMV